MPEWDARHLILNRATEWTNGPFCQTSSTGPLSKIFISLTKSSLSTASDAPSASILSKPIAQSVSFADLWCLLMWLPRDISFEKIQLHALNRQRTLIPSRNWSFKCSLSSEYEAYLLGGQNSTPQWTKSCLNLGLYMHSPLPCECDLERDTFVK